MATSGRFEHGHSSPSPSIRGPAPSGHHATAERRKAARFSSQWPLRNAERHLSAECGFRLSRDPDTGRAPDVWFVRARRVPAGDAALQFFEGAPDIAVESLSSCDRYVDMMTRVREYLDVGAPLVWA